MSKVDKLSDAQVAREIERYMNRPVDQRKDRQAEETRKNAG